MIATKYVNLQVLSVPGRIAWTALLASVRARVLSEAATNQVEDAVELVHRLTGDVRHNHTLTAAGQEAVDALRKLRNNAKMHAESWQRFLNVTEPLKNALQETCGSGVDSLLKFLRKQWTTEMSICELKLTGNDTSVREFLQKCEYTCLLEYMFVPENHFRQCQRRDAFGHNVVNLLAQFSGNAMPCFVDALVLWAGLQQELQQSDRRLQRELLFQVSEDMTARLEVKMHANLKEFLRQSIADGGLTHVAAVAEQILRDNKNMPETCRNVCASLLTVLQKASHKTDLQTQQGPIEDQLARVWDEYILLKTIDMADIAEISPKACSEVEVYISDILEKLQQWLISRAGILKKVNLPLTDMRLSSELWKHGMLTWFLEF